MSEIDLVCFDMAGTTMVDRGLVLESFRRTLKELGSSQDETARAEAYVVETMGQSKIDVFTFLFGERGPMANESFERHFLHVARELGVHEIPGVRRVVTQLVENDINVALTTGFSPTTREALVEELAWESLFPYRVSPHDVGRGRPAPDMLLSCVIHCGAYAVDSLAVIGDTASDMQAGRRAGARLCIGVMTGTDDERRLLDAGAHRVIDSVADLLTEIL